MSPAKSLAADVTVIILLKRSGKVYRNNIGHKVDYKKRRRRSFWRILKRTDD
jgi:hypothetical protein